MYIIGLICLVFFAAIGLCAFLLAAIRIFTDPKDENSYLIVLPDIDADNAEYSIRAAIRKISDIGKGEILCLCDQSDKEAVVICEKMKEHCPCLKIVDKDQLKMILGI